MYFWLTFYLFRNSFCRFHTFYCRLWTTVLSVLSVPNHINSEVYFCCRFACSLCFASCFVYFGSSSACLSVHHPVRRNLTAVLSVPPVSNYTETIISKQRCILSSILSVLLLVLCILLPILSVSSVPHLIPSFLQLVLRILATFYMFHLFCILASDLVTVHLYTVNIAGKIISSQKSIVQSLLKCTA